MSTTSLGKRRKDPADKLRRPVQFLLSDADYLRLLEASKGQDLSAFVRQTVLDRIDHPSPNLTEKLDVE